MLEFVPIKTWKNKSILVDAANQRNTYLCWAAALTRQLEALLKINELLDLDQTLSIQETIHLGLKISDDQQQRCEELGFAFQPILTERAGLLRVQPILQGLVDIGTVLHEDGPPLTFYRHHRALTKNCRRYTISKFKVSRLNAFLEEFGDELGPNKFEDFIVELLEANPIMASMRVTRYPVYEPFYNPSEEDCSVENMTHDHGVLLVEHGNIFSDGELIGGYFEYQDSEGINAGQEGFRKMIRGKQLISFVVDMKVGKTKTSPKRKRSRNA